MLRPSMVFTAFLVFFFLGVVSFYPRPVRAHSVLDLIQELEARGGLDTDYLYTILVEDGRLVNKERQAASAVHQNSELCWKIRSLWEKYGDVSPYALLKKESLGAGVSFFESNRTVFEKAKTDFGVKPHYILAILRVETYFGECVGDAHILPLLYEQYAATHNARARAFARKEIGALLRLSKHFGWDPYAFVGSSAGAMGIAQFLPSSFVYAVDGDEDGVIDLYSPEDAIPSIASYLSAHGWSDDKGRAIWGYNHSNRYVARIFSYALTLAALDTFNTE